MQPVINEEELKLHLSADEDDEDEDEDDDEPFETSFDKVDEEDELELEEEANNTTKPEVGDDRSETQGEENGEQEIESDVIHPAGVPDQEDPEAVALKKRT